MREIFAPKDPADTDPGRVFYTIRPEDVGKGTIPTEIGPIHLVNVIGRVMSCDIGKRLYRMPAGADPDGRVAWVWQCENEEQRNTRVAREERRQAVLARQRAAEAAGPHGPFGGMRALEGL